MLEDKYEDGYKQLILYKAIGIYNIINKEQEKLFKKYSISASQFNILMVIKHHSPKTGTNQTDIANKLIVCASNITKLLDKLLSQNLIERKINLENRRNNLITITKKGSDLLDEIWVDYAKVVDKLTTPLSEKERIALAKILTNWQEKIIDLK